MTPDDPRHGEYAGAVAHWFAGQRPCEDCARAEWRYRKRRKLRHLRGDSPTVASIGVVRRIQALHALGWTGPQIAEAAGISVNSMRSISYHRSTKVRSTTAAKIAAVYDRLSMTRPEGHYANRARSIAARRGWVPPLAWDDVDRDTEPQRAFYKTEPDAIDEVTVLRILGGDYTLAATPAERAEVASRWPGTLNELARLTGWKVERYFRAEKNTRKVAS